MCEINASGGRIRNTKVQRLFSASVRSEINIFDYVRRYLWLFGVIIIAAVSLDSLQFFGLGTLVVFSEFAGPVLLFGIMIAIVGVIVFVPIMVDCLGFFSFDFKESLWHQVTTCSLFATLMFHDFYERIRAVFHHYYKLCLRKNYFALGRTASFETLPTPERQVEGVEFEIGEISFVFEKTTIPVLDAFEAWLQILPTFPLGRHRKTLYRATGACPWLLVILLNNETHYLMHKSTGLCQSACHVCVVAVGMITFLMIITFFSFVPGFTFMSLSRMSRHEETGAALHCGE